MALIVGALWEPVPDDLFNGQTYYRQQLPGSGVTPEGFTVLVGDRWVTSFQTMEWMKIYLVNQVQDGLPGFLAPIFPYFAVTAVIISSSDMYVSVLAHESFHAYQGMVAPQRLAAAETAVRHESGYAWDDPAWQAAWQAELDLLAGALRAETQPETADLAGQFLAARRQRIQALGLDPELVAYEQQREWLEGLARYVELEIWRQAATASDYQPVPEMGADPEFKQYRGFNRRWNQEVTQLRRMAGDEGGGRFYYSGMAQAMLLDRLAPGWKDAALDEGVYLDALLEAALK